MSSIISNLKKRHIAARDERAIARVIAGADSPALRDEIIVLSQRQRNDRPTS